MKTVSLAVATCLVAGLAVTGCASKVHKSQVVQPAAKSQSLQNVEIHFNDNPRYSSRDDYNESMMEFRRILQEKIESSFPNVKITPPALMGPGLRISLTVQDFRYVSGAARFLTGVMVGNARLRVK